MLEQMSPFSFDDISEMPDPALLPVLDRPTVDGTGLTELQRIWRQDGVLILNKFLPEDLLDAYARVRAALGKPGGWRSDTPYEHVREIRDLSLYEPLRLIMEQIIGEEVGLHLNLTGWVSTERDLHADTYLNPPNVLSWYCATWIAVDDISPDSGPFEFVRGSHRWPMTRRDLLFKYMPESWKTDPAWPNLTQDAVSAAFKSEIQRRGGTLEQFVPKKGDVLIWHANLAHRGSIPKVPGTPRKSLISHYSGLEHRPDMPNRARHENGGAYMVFNHPLV